MLFYQIRKLFLAGKMLSYYCNRVKIILLMVLLE